MNAIAHEKLHGLDRDRLLAVVEPILVAHNVQGVELVWRTDRGQWVLELTVERPNSRQPGEGMTLDLCSEISRDLSAALDVANLIPKSYRLEVGSPGLERALYTSDDYQRFAGQSARLKLVLPLDDEMVLRGTLHGLSESGQVLLETERGVLSVEVASIEHARLTFDWKSTGRADGAMAPRHAHGRGRKAHKSKRGR
ncbi:MAG TPA: ribosome maturation factor RimP [Polyangiaceae bacterium]|jgi:ribosome maturation factor RimP